MQRRGVVQRKRHRRREPARAADSEVRWGGRVTRATFPPRSNPGLDPPPQTSLTARGLGASLRDMDLSVDMMRSGVAESDYDRRQLSTTASHLRDQGTAMQTKLMRGGSVPADELEAFQIRVELNKPRIVLKPTVAHPKGKMVGRSWVFEIDVNIPGVKDPVPVVSGVIGMKPDPSHPGKFLIDETQTLDFVIKKTREVNGREMRIEVEGHKQLTDHVMKEAISQFEAEFHEKPVLGGQLAWDNKAAFQHAYAEIEQAAIGGGKQLTQQQIADQAILKTRYGEARDKAGYHVTATVSGTTTIVTGDPPRLATVPDQIEALARPK
ncbi:MAG TPA: hypothetical protein VN253_14435 [Kofleriaceae bacterium]|nr:hypothetical protein [Kofleriaceae bacterium]